MGDEISAVLGAYHTLILREHALSRETPTILDAFHPKLDADAIVVADDIRADRTNVMAYVRPIRAEPDSTSFMLFIIEQDLELSRFEKELPDGQA